MEWKPINTAPKDDAPIDIWSRYHGRLTDYHRIVINKNNTFYGSGKRGGFTNVRDATHWMPIPDNPDKQQKGELK